MQTNTDTSKPRNSSWWDAKSDDEKRSHIAKMTAGRQRARKAANGNGRSTREEIRRQIAENYEAMGLAADEAALHDAKRALSGDGLAKPIITLVDAIRMVLAAIDRGEVEVVAGDGRLAFDIVTRERIA